MSIQVKSRGRAEFPVLMGRGRVELKHPLGLAAEKSFENVNMVEVEGIIQKYSSELIVDCGISGGAMPTRTAITQALVSHVIPQQGATLTNTIKHIRPQVSILPGQTQTLTNQIRTVVSVG